MTLFMRVGQQKIYFQFQLTTQYTCTFFV